MSGSNNDINVLQCSPIFSKLIEDERKYAVPLSEQAIPYEREGPLA
jgi:hypothetical protein